MAGPPPTTMTVRNVFVVGPDKKIKLVLIYPMTTGRNFDEVLRVIDSLQLTAKHKVATPAQLEAGRRRHHRRLGLGRRGEGASIRTDGRRHAPGCGSFRSPSSGCLRANGHRGSTPLVTPDADAAPGLYPIDPPVEPMLAKIATELPEGDGVLFEPKWDGFRAIVFRGSGRGLHPEPRAAAARSLFPGRPRGRPGAAAATAACVDGEIVIATGHGLDFDALQMRLHPAASRDRQAGAGRRPRRSSPSTCWPPTARICATCRRPTGVRGSNSCSQHVAPPVHLTPITRDRALAAEWLQRFEGAGLDGVIAKPDADCPISRASARCSRSSTSAPPTASSPASAGTRPAAALVGSLLLGLYDDNGHLHHVGVTSSFTMVRRRELAEELAPLRENALDEHPWRDVGRGGRRRARRECRAARAGGAPGRICPGSRCGSSGCAR